MSNQDKTGISPPAIRETSGFHRGPVFAACFLAILLFGASIALLGTVLPSVIERYQVNNTTAGFLFFWTSLGALLGSLVFGPIVDRYGYRFLLSVCSALMFLGLEGLAWAPSYALLPIAMVLIGFGGGVINGGSSALVADICESGRSAALSLLGVFFGLGACGAPLLFGLLSSLFSYRTIISSAGALLILPFLFFLLLRFPPPKKAHGLPASEMLGLARTPILLLFGAVLFCQSGMELTLGGWSAALFKEGLRMESSRAVMALSIYWLAMMVVRALMPWFLRIASDRWLLPIFMTLTASGSFWMIRASSEGEAALGLALTGAGLSPVFPLILGMVGDRYSALSGTAFSVCFVMALTGGMVLPALTGTLSDSFGLRYSLLLVPLVLLVQGILYGATLKALRFQKP